VQPSSDTPILDLLQPLPKPYSEKPSNSFIYGLATPLVFALLTGNFPLLFFVLVVTFVFMVAIAIHESGHLIAGWLAGLRFERASVGWFWIVRDKHGFRFRLKRHVLSGQAEMSLDRICHIRRKLVLFTLGGPLATFFTVFIGAGAAWAADSHITGSLTFMLDLFVYVSFFLFLIGLFPARYGRYPNDALLLKALMRSAGSAKPLLAMYALDMQKRNGADPFRVNRRWVELCYSQGVNPIGKYFEHWRDYRSAAESDNETAAGSLERCLAASSLLTNDQRDQLIAEVTYFAAWHRRDAAKAEIWFARISNLEGLHLVERLRAQAAIDAAGARFSEALECCDRALRYFHENPSGSRGPEVETGWLEWRQRIQELQAEPAHSVN